MRRRHRPAAILGAVAMMVVKALANGADGFADREPLLLGSVVEADLAGATVGIGEPGGFPQSLGFTRWWRINAPETGRFVIRIDRTSPLLPSMIALRAGQSGALEVASSNSLVEPCPHFYAPRRHWDFAVDARAGDEIVLGADVAADELVPMRLEPDGSVVVDYSGPTAFRFQVEMVASPANDSLAKALRLEADFAGIDTQVFAATSEAGEPRIPNGFGRTVWYEWTAPVGGQLSIGSTSRRVFASLAVTAAAAVTGDTGWLTAQWNQLALPYWLPVGYAGGGVLGSVGVVNTVGSGGGRIDFPPPIDCRPIPSGLTVPVVPLVGVYTGETVEGLSRVAQGKDVAFVATAGTTYRIAVDASEGDLGSVHLLAQFTPAPANDGLQQAAPITGLSADASGHTIAATREDFEGAGPGSAWWAWSPDAEGPVRLEAASPDAANVQLDVRVIATDGSLRSLASAKNAATFYAAKGARYRIGVAPEENPGVYSLSLRQVPARLRPVIIHPGSPRSGLLIAETGWKQALLQEASGNQWADRGIVLPQAAREGDVLAGYYLPVEVALLDPSAAGLFRVWLLDFDLPAPAVKLAMAPFPFESGALAPVDLVASPGRQFDLESSDNLETWGVAAAGLWSAGSTRIHVPVPLGQRQQFFRVREVTRTVLPLLLGN